MQSGLKYEIENISYEVNDILTSYISIHDDILAFSIRKVIPIPFFFKKINYKEHYIALKQLSSQLQLCYIEAKNLQQELDTFSQPYIYLGNFKEYILALHVTVDKLYNICYKMQSKIDEKKPYPMANYDSDMQSYNASVKNYLSYGESLNMEYRATMLSF